MQRILVACAVPEKATAIVELLRREAPAIHVCQGVQEFLHRVEVPRPVLEVVILHPPVGAAIEQLKQVLAAAPHSPWLFVSGETPGTQEQEQLNRLLQDRGSLLCSVDPQLLRSTLQRWLPEAVPQGGRASVLNSNALSRLYQAGGRALADRIVEVFLQKAPELVIQARRDQAAGDFDKCLQALAELAQRAGTVGAHSVQHQVESIQEQLHRETNPVDGHWTRLEQALEIACRVLQQQKKQDRTV